MRFSVAPLFPIDLQVAQVRTKEDIKLRGLGNSRLQGLAAVIGGVGTFVVSGVKLRTCLKPQPSRLYRYGRHGSTPDARKSPHREPADLTSPKQRKPPTSYRQAGNPKPRRKLLNRNNAQQTLVLTGTALHQALNPGLKCLNPPKP